MDLKKSVAKQIKQYRELKGETQESLSEKAGISQHYLSLIECANRMPSLKTLINIINALGVSSDEIFSDVINTKYSIKANELSSIIAELPAKEQKRIFAVLEVLIREAQ